MGRIEPILPDALAHLGPDASHALPKVRQLYLNLRDAIERGELPFGAQLPATRQLARHLGIGRNTVIEVYEQLVSEGLLIADGRRGTRVARQRMAPPVASTAWVSSKRSGDTLSRASTHRELAPGEPDTTLFPAAAWRRALAGASRLHAGELGYQSRSSAATQQSIARYLATYRSLVVDPEQIIITASTRQSLALAAMLYADPGDTAWSESPGYVGAVDAFRQFGLRVVPCALDAQGLVPPQGTENPRIVYLTPCFQYPMGMSLGADRRDELLQLSRDSGCVLFEDDYDSEFRDDSQPRPALAANPQGARVLHAGTFSKILFPAVRVAWLVVPCDNVEPAHRCLRSIGGGNTHIAQAAVRELLDNGTIARHLQQARHVYGQRRRALNAALAHRSGFQSAGQATGSLSLVLHLARRVRMASLVHALDQAQLGAQPLEWLQWDIRQPASCRAVVIGLGAVDSMSLPDSLQRLEAAVAEAS